MNDNPAGRDVQFLDDQIYRYKLAARHTLPDLDVRTVLSYPALKGSIQQVLSQMSPAARAMFGIQGSAMTIEGWLALNTFDLLAPLSLAFFPILMEEVLSLSRYDLPPVRFGLSR